MKNYKELERELFKIRSQNQSHDNMINEIYKWYSVEKEGMYT